MTFKDRTLDDVDILFNYEEINELYEYKTIEKPDANTRFCVVECKVPLMLMTRRDLVCKLTRTRLNNRQVLLRCHSTDHPQYPLREDRIRAYMITYALFEQQENALKFTFYSAFDMKGIIPRSIIDMTICSVQSELGRCVARGLN